MDIEFLGDPAPVPDKNPNLDPARSLMWTWIHFLNLILKMDPAGSIIRLLNLNLCLKGTQTLIIIRI